MGSYIPTYVRHGGGRPDPPPPSNGTDLMIEGILGPALEGLENEYDSDALIYINNVEDEVATKLDNNCNIVMVSDKEIDSEVPTIRHFESEPSCSFSIAEKSLENKKHKIEQGTSVTSLPQHQTEEDNDNHLKWEGWTPKSLKRPVSDVLKVSSGAKENNSWLKRRRPDQRNLSDQLIQEKINLVKILAENAREESRKRMLILDEQLKQETIKTQKLLE